MSAGSHWRRRIAAIGAVSVAAAVLAGAGARAEDSQDPAIPVIAAFDQGLLEAMKGGQAAGAEGRFKRLAPLVERTFDLPTMTRFAVGSAWSGFSASDQTALVRAFGRLSAANLARNFDSYAGEQIKISPTVDTRGPDKLVHTELVKAGGEGVQLNYRMRKAATGWRVIDVYYGAISQLTAQRADFSAAISQGGAPALLKSLNAKVDQLLAK
jgi:phospholipid transport system substrate-binding protein